MTWATGQLSHFGPPQSLPSFSDFVTSLGQDAIHPALYELRSAGTPDSGPAELAWSHEYLSRSTNDFDEINTGTDTTKHSLITPLSTPDHDYVVNLDQRPNLKRPYIDDPELLTETVRAAPATDQRSQSKSAEAASPCLFDGFVPFKKPRRDRNQPLNPLYTRDGSPRKRLAQACERCRTQKIKCQLKGLTCVQCVKQGFVCEFSTSRHKRVMKGRQRKVQASQKPHECSSDRSASQIGATVKSMISEEGLVEDLGTATTSQGISESNGNSLLPSVAGSAGNCPQLLQAVTPDIPAKRPQARQRYKPPVADDLSIDIDPMLFDASLTRHYTEQYFTHINRPPYRILPRAAISRWLDTIDKSKNDKMLLYAILAAGTIFSHDRSRDVHRVVFTRIAESALKACHSCFELPVIHTLLVLSEVCAFSADVTSAHAHSISAIRCCYGLQLNNDLAERPGHKTCGYVEDAQMAECSRRTFWLAYHKAVMWSYCLEALGGSPGLQGCLRLPCNDDAYETSTVPRSRAFPFRLSDVASSQLTIPVSSPMALLIHGTIALESSIRRIISPSTPSNADHSNSWATATQDLHRHLRVYRERAEELASSHEAPDICLEFSIMASCIATSFHRRAPPNLLPPTQATHHYRQTRWHAARLLEGLEQWQEGINNPAFDPEFPIWILDPFTSTSIVSAFDVLTSAGLLSSALDPRQRSDDGRLTLRALATLAITVVSDLAEYSQLAERQLGPMKKRLAALLAGCNAAQSEKRVFRFREPLVLLGENAGDGNGDGKGDVVYGMPRWMMLSALGVDGGDEDQLLEMA